MSSASLCESCNSAHIIRGFRESDVITICKEAYPEIRVPFAVHACSGYSDKGRPTWEQMEKLAIEVRPEPMKRIRGFQTVLEEVSHSDDDDE